MGKNPFYNVIKFLKEGATCLNENSHVNFVFMHLTKVGAYYEFERNLFGESVFEMCYKN